MLIGHSISNLDGTILSMDEAVCDLLHTPRQSIIGQSFVEITHPADRSRNVAVVESIRDNSAPEVIRKRYLRQDGSHVWTDVSISRLLTGSEKGRLVGTIHLASLPEAAGTPAAFWKSAHQAEKAMLSRIAELGDAMFFDYPWFIMIRLYLAEAEGRLSDISDLKPIAAMADSSVQRWIKVLASEGLVLSGLNQKLIQLTAQGVEKIEGLIGADRRTRSTKN